MPSSCRFHQSPIYFSVSVIFFSLSVFLLILSAQAKTLDRWGNVYPVKERDMRELIAERAKNFDVETWKATQKAKVQDSITKFRPAYAVKGLPSSKDGNLYKVDLTYRVPHDITDINGNVVYPEGFIYNPLEVMLKHGVSFNKIIVVLNGERKNELKWFTTKFPNYREPHIMLLITDGSVFDVADKIEKKTQYLSELIKEKFLINETPSVVVQIPGEKYLTVKAYRVDEKGKELPDTIKKTNKRNKNDNNVLKNQRVEKVKQAE